MSLNLESKIGQRATQVFTDHRNANVIYLTSDGTAFYERGDAANHAQKGKGGVKLSPVVVTVTRDEWLAAQKAAETAAAAKANAPKPKAAKTAPAPAATEPASEPAQPSETNDGNG